MVYNEWPIIYQRQLHVRRWKVASCTIGRLHECQRRPLTLTKTAFDIRKGGLFNRVSRPFLAMFHVKYWLSSYYMRSQTLIFRTRSKTFWKYRKHIIDTLTLLTLALLTYVVYIDGVGWLIYMMWIMVGSFVLCRHPCVRKCY